MYNPIKNHNIFAHQKTLVHATSSRSRTALLGTDVTHTAAPMSRLAGDASLQQDGPTYAKVRLKRLMPIMTAQLGMAPMAKIA